MCSVSAPNCAVDTPYLSIITANLQLGFKKEFCKIVLVLKEQPFYSGKGRVQLRICQ